MLRRRPDVGEPWCCREDDVQLEDKRDVATELSESSNSESVHDNDSRFVEPFVDCAARGEFVHVGTAYIII